MSIGSFLGANQDARKAADAQRYAADQSTALQREQFEYLKQIAEPQRQVGLQSLPALTGFINQPQQNFSFDYDAYFNSPEYAAQRGQAELTAMRNASATGGLRGGDAQVALASIAPQLAQQARQNAMSEFSLNQGANLNRYNMLQGLAGLGTGATSQLGNAAQNFGQMAGNNQLYIGNAMANKYGQYTQNRNGLISDFATAFMGGF